MIDSAKLSPIPVTVLTGFLGAGKTTLLKHILKAEHGLKIAVIENEYSETPIDGQLLGDAPAYLQTLANGCLCCTLSGDLQRSLLLLLEKQASGEVHFDRLIIECTGLADPAPVAQSFLADESLREGYQLDGIVTLVDALNAERHLQEAIAQAQVGFADRILISKSDLVDAAHYEALAERLQRINRRAEIEPVLQGQIELRRLFDLRGFAFDGPLSLRPVQRVANHDRINTLVLRSQQALDAQRLSEFIEDLLHWHGNSLLRYKGVLHIAGEARRLICQGVLRLYGFDWDAAWGDQELRESVLVLIGDNLPEAQIRQGFAAILAD